MTSITICRGSHGGITGFVAHGHAGDAPEGENIVCAAISAVTQTAMLGLVEYLKFDVDVAMRDGYFRLCLSDGDAADESARAILETMVLGLLSIEQSAPKNSLEISDRRCNHKCTA